MATGQCPSSSVSGWQFNSHYDCINAGYGVAQKTFQANYAKLLEKENNVLMNKKKRREKAFRIQNYKKNCGSPISKL